MAPSISPVLEVLPGSHAEGDGVPQQPLRRLPPRPPIEGEVGQGVQLGPSEGEVWRREGGRRSGREGQLDWGRGVQGEGVARWMGVPGCGTGAPWRLRVKVQA